MNGENEVPSFWAFFIPCFLVLMLFLVMGGENSKKAREECESKGGQYFESRGKSAICHKGIIK